MFTNQSDVVTKDYKGSPRRAFVVSPTEPDQRSWDEVNPIPFADQTYTELPVLAAPEGWIEPTDGPERRRAYGKAGKANMARRGLDSIHDCKWTGFLVVDSLCSVRIEGPDPRVNGSAVWMALKIRDLRF